MIKSFFIALSCILLFLSLLTAAISLDLSSSLKYENIQNQAANLSPIINQQFNIIQQVDENLPLIKNYCNNNPDYVFSYEGYVLHFPCQDVNKDEITIITDTIENFISDSYYKTYNCSYWNCFNQYSPLFLISEKSDNYWQKIFYISLAVFIITTAILFILFKKKQNLPFIVGGFMVIASLPLLGISQILSHLQNVTLSSAASLLFSQSNYIFIRMIIIGVGILLIGIIIELFRAGFKIYDMFSKHEVPKSLSKDSNVKSKKK
ncbi:MAG: hypothetical protein WAU65_00475 [Candidatus Nanoarchaeia archaeon]